MSLILIKNEWIGWATMSEEPGFAGRLSDKHMEEACPPGYMVKRGLQVYGHYETKEAATEAIRKELFGGQMPAPILTSMQGDEHYHSPDGVVSLLREPAKRPQWSGRHE